MGVIQASVAAATAALGYDLLNGNQLQQVGYERIITGVGLCGSAAAGDTAIDLYVDTVLVGQFYNTTTGFPTNDHIIPVEFNVPANSKIICKVTDAASTNPINLTIKTVE